MNANSDRNTTAHGVCLILSATNGRLKWYTSKMVLFEEKNINHGTHGTHGTHGKYFLFYEPEASATDK